MTSPITPSISMQPALDVRRRRLAAADEVFRSEGPAGGGMGGGGMGGGDVGGGEGPGGGGGSASAATGGWSIVPIGGGTGV